MASSHFLRNTRAILETVFSAGPPDTTITATVVGENGNTVASGQATQDGTNTAKYTFPCPPQASLNRLTTTWAGTWGGVAQSIETYAEVVGGHLWTISEIREYRDGEVADETEYPDAELRAARDRILEAFQVCCGVPFVPRYEREVFDGRGKQRLWLPFKRPLRLISVTIDDVALTAPELAEIKLYVTGRIERTTSWPRGMQNVVVEWERGFKRPPAEVSQAAKSLAQYEAISSEITDRMITVANELGTVRLSVPGKNRPTGIPLVDAVLDRYDERETELIAIRS